MNRGGECAVPGSLSFRATTVHAAALRVRVEGSKEDRSPVSCLAE